MVIGAAGGSKITTSVAQIIVKHLWYGIDLKRAMDEARVHHQLMPNVLVVEDNFKIEYEKLLHQIEKIGHNIEFKYPADGFCAVTSISHVNRGNVVGVPDIRRKTGGVGYV
ncbi:unnamed protein product [Callosobruchus maculatus]|nr:unnamed protein product [Callosobruchus maculatus]